MKVSQEQGKTLKSYLLVLVISRRNLHFDSDTDGLLKVDFG